MIYFTKMHGLGNDFIVIDNTAGNIQFDSKQVAALANRRFGIGFDQLLMVETSSNPDVDFRYIIYNADGQQVGQCVNGARCFARFVKEKNLTKKNPITVQTSTSMMNLLINDDDTVCVDMGKPMFAPSDIPLLVDKQSLSYSIQGFRVGALSVGNPHCVLIVEQLNKLDVQKIGVKIQSSPKLPNQANVGFMQILNTNEINLRVFERGAGETMACGSGACAAVAYGIKLKKLSSPVSVHLTGGDVIVQYNKKGSILLSGPAEFVFEGSINI